MKGCIAENLHKTVQREKCFGRASFIATHPQHEYLI